MAIHASQYGDICLYIKDENRREIELKLDQSDRVRTEEILKRNGKNLDFSLYIDKPTYTKPPSKFFLYLGQQNAIRWDSDYAIQLSINYSRDGTLSWIAEREDMDRIRKQFWCAATAKGYLYDEFQNPVISIYNQPIETVIGLSDDNWYLLLYEGVKAGLESLNQQADITTPFEQLTHICRTAREEAEGSEILALYLRIRQFLDSFSYSVEAILRSPAERANSNVSFFASNDFSSSEYQYKIGLAKFLALQTVEKFNGRTCPTAFASNEIITTNKIEENHFAFQCVLKLTSYLNQIAQEIEEYIEDVSSVERRTPFGIHKNKLSQDIQKHQTKLQEVKSYLQKCRYYTQKFSELNLASRHPISVNPYSELICYDQRYSNIWKLAGKIDSFIKYIDTSDEAVPFQVAPFNEVYHKWCLSKLIEALEELGFSKITQGETTPLYGNPRFNTLFCEMQHSGSPVLVKLFFERKYRFISSSSPIHDYGFWKPLCNQLDKADWKHTPDICLEFHDMSKPFPFLITLDPTLARSSAIWQQKYKYKITLRANTPRGWIPIVKAAWAITPGREQQSHEPYYLCEALDLSEGVILLNHTPESQTALKQTLRKIISHSRLVSL